MFHTPRFQKVESLRAVATLTMGVGLALAGCAVGPPGLGTHKSPGTNPFCTPLEQSPYSTLATELEEILGSVLADSGEKLPVWIGDVDAKMNTAVQGFKTKLASKWGHPAIESIQWNVRVLEDEGPAFAVELVVSSSKDTLETPTVHLNFWVDRSGETPKLIPTERYFFVDDGGSIHACSENRGRVEIIPGKLATDFGDRDWQLWHSSAGVSSLHGISQGMFESTGIDHLQRKTTGLGITMIGLDNCCETTDFNDLAPLRMAPHLGILELNNPLYTYDLTPLSNVPRLMEIRAIQVAAFTLSEQLAIRSVRLREASWRPAAAISQNLRLQEIHVEGIDVIEDNDSKIAFQTLLKNTSTLTLGIKCKGHHCLPSILSSWLEGTGITELHIGSSVAGAPSDTEVNYGIRAFAEVKTLQVLDLGCNRVRDRDEDMPFHVRLVDAEYLLRNLPSLTTFAGSLSDGFNVISEDPTEYLGKVIQELDRDIRLGDALACPIPTGDDCDCAGKN